MVYYNDSSPLIINPPFEFEKEDLFELNRGYTPPLTPPFFLLKIDTEIFFRRETFHTQATDAANHAV